MVISNFSGRNSRSEAPKSIFGNYANDEETCKTCSVKFSEDTLRFILLALLILGYLLVGAAIFEALERGTEMENQQHFKTALQRELVRINALILDKEISMTDINNLLYLWGNGTENGFLDSKRKWDFTTSFAFSYTIVSTIGYGALAPKTTAGRIFCIFYGLFGCSCGLLFFNLFLERIITFLTFIMRSNYIRRFRQRVTASEESQVSAISDQVDTWRPSVYWVMLYLFVTSVFLALMSSIIYMKMEKWAYIDSLYFCFVSFATIGFGDFVAAQEPNSFYGSTFYAYHIGNFLVIVFGGSCIYSLFNIISITIKQRLTWIIRHYVWFADSYGSQNAEKERTPSGLKREQTKTMDGMYNTEAERKLSGDNLLVTNNHLPSKQMKNNKIETVHERSESHSASSMTDDLIPGQVGSLAMISDRFDFDESM